MILSFDIFLSILAIFSLGFSSFFGNKKAIMSFFFSIAIFLIPIVFKILNFNHIIDIGVLKINFFAPNIASLSIYVCTIFALICVFCEKKVFKIEKYEVYFLISLLGIASSELSFGSGNFLKIYILLELISAISVVLIAGSFRHKNSGEAGMKYIILSSLGSIMFLLGLAMLYFKLGNFEVLTIYSANIETLKLDNLYDVGILLIFVAIFMKMGVFPFQNWIADAYSGSRISILNAINTLPKIGILVCVFKLINFQRIYVSQNVCDKLAIFLILGIVFASVRLLSQKCLKRLLAYSSSVTVAIIFCYCIIVRSSVLSSSIYHNLIIYILSYICVSCIIAISCVFLFKNDVEKMELGSDNFVFNEFFYIQIMIGILSLASIPPLLGFFAKFYFIKQAIDVGTITSKFYIAAMLFSSILGSFYYFNLPSKFILKEKIGQFSGSKLAYNVSIVASICLTMFLIAGLFVL